LDEGHFEVPLIILLPDQLYKPNCVHEDGKGGKQNEQEEEHAQEAANV